MNKFLAFLLSFSILNSSFAEDLLCHCCYNNYFKNYQNGKSFPKDGLDVYVVDDFTDYEIFNHYYKPFFDEEIFFLPKEQYNIDVFSRKDDSSNELHFSSHEKPWYYHLYKKEENDVFNENLVTTLAKKMSTEGGNNFDWENGVDRARWFNRFRSKVRHNKNVIIVKLKYMGDKLFEKTIRIFRKFVNMSYRPCPIIFTGNFDYVNFEKDLNTINENYTKRYEDKKNVEITRGMVDYFQEISNYECFYIRQNNDFVKNVKEKLELAANYHNSKDIPINVDTFNIAVIGLPRSGKTTLANIILDNLLAKASNDVTSVTRKKTRYPHKNVNEIPIAVIDTPGFENNKDSVDAFIEWLDKENKDDNTKNNIQTINLFLYIINAKNFPKPDEFAGPFYSKDELNLFKKIKKEKIPLVFVITRSESFENGYKYLRKWFGDLSLNNDLSNFKSEEENWKAEDQWICPNWTRGTLIQLKNDYIEDLGEYTLKYGLVKLMNIIKELFYKNEEYKNRKHNVFGKNHSLSYILDELKNQFMKQQGFNNDENQGPIIDFDEDLIVNKVDKKIPKCLDLVRNTYLNNKNEFKAALLSYEKNLKIFNPLQRVINAFAQGKKEITILTNKINLDEDNFVDLDEDNFEEDNLE